MDDFTQRTKEELDYYGIFPQELRGKKISPNMSSEKDLEEKAHIVAEMIDMNNREKFSFYQITEQYNRIHDTEVELACFYDVENNCERIFLDTGSGSKQAGQLEYDVAEKVIETKIICQDCPLRMECLATSIADNQNTRMSQKERVIPGTGEEYEKPTLILNEWLMSGGYTPQERKVIFEKVCDILEEKDKVTNNVI